MRTAGRPAKLRAQLATSSGERRNEPGMKAPPAVTSVSGGQAGGASRSARWAGGVAQRGGSEAAAGRDVDQRGAAGRADQLSELGGSYGVQCWHAASFLGK